MLHFLYYSWVLKMGDEKWCYGWCYCWNGTFCRCPIKSKALPFQMIKIIPFVSNQLIEFKSICVGIEFEWFQEYNQNEIVIISRQFGAKQAHIESNDIGSTKCVEIFLIALQIPKKKKIVIESLKLNKTENQVLNFNELEKYCSSHVYSV